MRAKTELEAEVMTVRQPPPPPPASGGDLPNDEWDLQELIERFSAELDKVQDTLSLKSLARGMTFGPGVITLQLNAFLRFDARRDKILFRSAQPGEVNASTLKLELPPILRDQIQTHGIQFKEAVGACQLNFLPDVTPAETAQLNRLGIFTLSDLNAMTMTPDMRTLVAAKAGLSFEKLSAWMEWPFIRQVRVSSTEMFVIGERFGKRETKSQVFLNNASLPVLEWSNELVRVKVPEGKRSGIVVLVTEQGGSNCYLWTSAAITRNLPASEIPGSNAASTKRLAKARINTVEELLTLDADEVAKILQKPRRQADDLLESARRCLINQ